MIIYFYGLYDNKGGMENYARTLIKGVIRENKSIHFTIIRDCPHIAYEEEFLKLGCDIIQIPAKNKKPIAYYRSLVSIFKKVANDGDVLHLNIMSYRNGLLFRAAEKSRARTILVAHGSGIQGTRFRWLHPLNRRRFLKIGTKVAISKEAAQFVFGQATQIITNAIDPSTYIFNQESRSSVRRELGLSEKIMLLGQVGRVHPIKNQLFSIKLLESLLKDDPNYALCLVGKEQDFSIRRYIAKNHLNSSVFLLGEKDPKNYYSAFDILLLPSIKEGAGLVLYEGSANGLPVIASTGVPEAKELSNVTYLPLKINGWIYEVKNALRPRGEGQDILNLLLEQFVNSYLVLYRQFN